jgi:hypothetical protein
MYQRILSIQLKRSTAIFEVPILNYKAQAIIFRNGSKHYQMLGKNY